MMKMTTIEEQTERKKLLVEMNENGKTDELIKACEPMLQKLTYLADEALGVEAWTRGCTGFSVYFLNGGMRREYIFQFEINNECFNLFAEYSLIDHSISWGLH